MVTVQFNQVMGTVEEATERAALELAVRIVGQAKALCHVQTGLLRNSIMWKSPKSEGGFNDGSGEFADKKINVKAEKYSVWVGSWTHYGPYEEYGTRYRAPHPFLRPAKILLSGEAGKSVIKLMMKAEMAMGKLVKGQTRVFK